MQLPKAGGVAVALFEAGYRRSLPAIDAAAMRAQPRGHLVRQQAQHRAQCRANCMSKANF